MDHDTSNNALPATGQPTYEELQAKIAELQATAEHQAKTGVYFKVGDKGGVSVYGLQRFPITLYGGQWDKLLETATGISVDDLRGYGAPMILFMDANRDKLSDIEETRRNKQQNTVRKVAETALDGAIRTTFAAIKKANPGWSVAEVEEATYKTLGLAR